MAGEFIADSVFDAGLNYIAVTIGDAKLRIDVTNAVATTHTEATATFTLGDDQSIVLVGPAAGTVSGRKITVPATSGTIGSTDTATHWALTDDVGNELLATGPLSTTPSVTSGNPFTLTAIEIEIPDAA